MTNWIVVLRSLEVKLVSNLQKYRVCVTTKKSATEEGRGGLRGRWRDGGI